MSLEYQAVDSTGSYVARTVERHIGMIVGGGTDFDLTFTDSTDGQASFTIANTGNNPALAVAVRVPEQGGYTVTGSSASMVGMLDSGDYTIVSFEVSQSAAAPMARNASAAGLLLAIDYTDTTGKRHTVERTVLMQSGSGNSTAAMPLFGTQQRAVNYAQYWWVGLVILAMAAGYAIYCKKTGKPIIPEKALSFIGRKKSRRDA